MNLITSSDQMLGSQNSSFCMFLAGFSPLIPILLHFSSPPIPSAAVVALPPTLASPMVLNSCASKSSRGTATRLWIYYK